MENIIDKLFYPLELLDFKQLLGHDALETKTDGPQKRVPRTILGLEIMCRMFFAPVMFARAPGGWRGR